MRTGDILRILQVQPFRAFRLYVLETTVFEVRHPEFVFVGRSTLTLTLSPGTAEEREVVIALMHITRLEPIPPAPASPPTSAEAAQP
jgi:hypothetical protein